MGRSVMHASHANVEPGLYQEILAGIQPTQEWCRKAVAAINEESRQDSSLGAKSVVSINVSMEACTRRLITKLKSVCIGALGPDHSPPGSRGQFTPCGLPLVGLITLHDPSAGIADENDVYRSQCLIADHPTTSRKQRQGAQCFRVRSFDEPL